MSPRPLLPAALLAVLLGLAALPTRAADALPAAADAATDAGPDTGAAAADDPGADDAPEDGTGPNPRDPYEGLNRRVFAFNDKLDTEVLKPVAQAYQKLVPEMARTGVTNVLGNFGDVWSVFNHALQGKLGGTARMTLRVLTNTTFGIAGLMDPATELGLERESEDFGQTLGRWGVPSGPYVVLPLLGPSTARDTAATPVDIAGGSTFTPVDSTGASVGVSVLKVVNTRANLLGASQVLDGIALDRYSFLRDAYLARRRNQVYDGNPPDDDTAP